MKKYKEYKDSGIDWIGEIPSNWTVKKIKHKCLVKARVGWKGLKSDQFLIQGYSYLVTGSDFKNDTVIWQNCYQIDQERYEEDPYIQLFNNDLLITKDGTIGKLAIVENLNKPACLNSGIFVVRPTKDDITTQYLFWLLKSNSFIQFNDLTSYGSTIQHLYQNIFLEFWFPLPPLDTQIVISDFLRRKTSEIDDIITTNKKLIELYEEEKATIINQAVTKGINTKVKLKPSGVEWLGDIPEHWEVRPLKYLLEDKLKYGANEPAEEENHSDPRYIRITDFGNDGNLRDDTFKSLSKEKSEEYLLKDGDLLFARSGATVGKTFQFKDYKGQACFAGYLIRARPNVRLVTSDFIYNFTKSPSYENWKNSIFSQSTIQNIGADKYAFLQIGFPSVEEQVEINKFIFKEVDSKNTKIQKAQKLIELLTEYRTTLISEVVTGKIKVTT